MSATQFAMYAAMCYGVLVISVSLYILVLAGLQWVRRRTEEKEQEQFLRKACRAMQISYEAVDKRGLIHLIKTMDISIRIAADRERVARSHPLANFIYQTKYAGIPAKDSKAK